MDGGTSGAGAAEEMIESGSTVSATTRPGPPGNPLPGKGIRKIFSEVPETYELVNHVLSLGLDIVWRRRAARLAAGEGGKRWLDVCTGTGETAAYLCRFAPDSVQVFAADFSLPMLRHARRKGRGLAGGAVLSDVGQLPFPDDSFDLVTISFATRNINLSREILIAKFEEFRRVLRPGGLFVNLETSQPRSVVIRKLYHAYVRLVVRRVGSFISGSKAGYAYLSSTIPRFFSAEELSGILSRAGFRRIGCRRVFLGTAAIHTGRK